MSSDFHKIKKSVIVLGMHRSGTSMISGILNILGIDMGKNLMDSHWSNPLGHFENLEFVKLNDEILKAAGGSWDNPPSEDAILAQKEKFSLYIKRLIENEASGIWGWKDPRTVLTIELFLPYLKNPYFIICHRNPKNISASLKQRDGKDIDSSLKLIQIYETRILNFIKKYPKLKNFHIWYEKFISNPEPILRELTWFLGIIPSEEQFLKALNFVRPKGKVWMSHIKTKTLVSIIIPVFNKMEYTKNCISTLYQVTPSNLFELIIVNNGSTDGTKEFLEDFVKDHPNLKIINNKENFGFAKACNQGAQLAKGEYLLFLNNDIIPLANWLEEMLNIIKNDKKVGIVGSKLLFPDGTIQHAGVVICDFPEPISPHHIYYKKSANILEVNQVKEYKAVTGACMLIPKRVFDQVGRFDEKFINGYEDVDLCFKVRELGYKVIYCPNSVLYHFEGQTNNRHKFEYENVKRLNQKWQGKIKPDIRVNSISIIIVTYNSSEHISNCLNSILSFTKLPYEVLVIDNDSKDDTQDILTSFHKRFPLVIKPIFNKGNLGFARACNQGIKLAKGQYIILLNPDTSVTPDWDKRLIAHFKNKDIGAVGPISNFASGKQSLSLYLKDLPISNGDFSIIQISEEIYKYYKDKDVETKLLTGFCLVIKKDVFKKLGLLDESLFLGNEDLEFSWRLQLYGYKLLVATDVFIYHKGQASFQTSPYQEVNRLVQESTDRLAYKLIEHYGFGNVPVPEELWGIAWFKPSKKYENMFKEIDKKVSIILVNYKNAHDTLHCLESIYNIKYNNFQIIIVENGSQDDSTDKIIKWAKDKGKHIIFCNKDFVFPDKDFTKELIIIENEENLGFSGANNIGIKYALKCKADYVWLLNNDTVVDENALSRLVRSSIIDERIGLVSSKIYFYEDKKKVQYDGDIPSDVGKEDNNDDFLKIVEFAPACSLLIKSAVFKDIGFLNTDYFLYFEDNDFCKRAKSNGWFILYDPCSVVYHKGGASIGKWLKTPISAYYAPRNFLYCNVQYNNISDCFAILEKTYWDQLNKSPACIKGFVEGIKDFILGKKGKIELYKLDPKIWEDWPDIVLENSAKDFVNNPDKWTFLKFLSLAQGLCFKRYLAKDFKHKDKAKLFCKKGEQLFEKGEIDKAISLFEQAIKTDPSCAQAYNDLAAIYWHKQDREKAFSCISMAMKLCPDDLDIMWNCGQIMLGLGFTREAQEIYEIYKELEENEYQKEQRDKILKENYPPDTKKLIVFLIPGYDIVNGGILSIYSIYKETKKLKSIHNAETIICTIPGDPDLIRHTKFHNKDYIYKFSQILSYFSNLKELMIHIPLHVIDRVTIEFLNNYYFKLKKIKKIHFNIMLQNIEALPQNYKEIFRKLKKMGFLTCTTAHDQYSTLEVREKLGIPLHRLSTYVSPEWYNKKDYKEKEDIMIVSPDSHFMKMKILNLIQTALPNLDIHIINNLHYEDYKKLISRAKWSLTFGEGLDGYFVETIFSGGISFAVYNPNFFTADFKKLRTVYHSYEELVKNICYDLKELDNEAKFSKYQNQQYFMCKAYYNYNRYLENLRMFYEHKYTFL